MCYYVFFRARSLLSVKRQASTLDGMKEMKLMINARRAREEREKHLIQINGSVRFFG